MLNLIRMEWYKLRTSKLFMILLAISFVSNALLSLAIPLFSKMLAGIPSPVNLSYALQSPFTLGLLMIVVFISATSFSYLDFAGGYIKNIAGQVGDRGKIVISMLIIIGVHNLIFFAVGALSNVVGAAMAGALVVDGNVAGGILTLLLKWLLSMAISSVLLFFTVGIRNKSLGIIGSVVFGANVLSLAYMGISMGLKNLLHVDINVGDYMPDALMGSVDVINNSLVVNAIVVSAVFIAAFTILTFIVFKKRDVK